MAMDDGAVRAEARRTPARLERKAAVLSGKAARGFDKRFGAAKWTRTALKKVFPDHWSFLLGEIAAYSFIVLLLTGTFLTLFFRPSMTEIVYHGSYVHLRGIKMSEAYASTLGISFDVRGGLLVRQIHHWAALLFVGSIAIHAIRIFFTGAFRKPREINWVIGTVMFALAAGEGFAGYSLPDDLLSGTGVRIAEGIMLSIPIVGSYITFFVFGGQYPGDAFIPRLYIVHVLIIPGLLLALITAHLMTVWHQGHTQWPGKEQTERNEVGNPLYPVFMAKTGALFFFTFAVLAVLGTLAQINPIEALVWLFRVGFFVFPAAGFLIARHVCLALQGADARKLREGEGYGIAVQGRAYAPVSRPLPEDTRAIVEARQPVELLRPTPRHLVPLPTPHRMSEQVRARLNHFYVRTRLETPSSLAVLDGADLDGQDEEEE